MKSKRGYSVLEDENWNRVFRIIAMVLLIALVAVLPVITLIKAIDYNTFVGLVAEYGKDAEIVKNYTQLSVPNFIYSFNCILCVISIIVQVVYWIPRLKESLFDKKTTRVEKLKKNWPVILLAIFMLWTSVGCIQAGMEMNAEITIKNAKSEDEVPQRLIDIANWSPTDRMANTSNIYQNAADRAWGGCENLRDGYFSFLFYATVMLNVLMLGNNAEDKKKWVIRALLISSFIVGFLDLLAFFRPTFLNGLIDYKRFLFNNSNHFAYYFSVVSIMSVVMFIKDENIFFKGISLINIMNYFFIMVINNTFGAQIGIGFAMIFLLFVALIRLVSRHKVKEFILYMVTFVLFIVACTSIGNVLARKYSKNSVSFTYTYFKFNLVGKPFQFYSNSLNDAQAEELGLAGTTLNGNPMKWGTGIEASTPFMAGVVYNIKDLGEDINSLYEKFFQKSAEENKYKDLMTVSEKMVELENKYPKVSGETLEEFNARQDKIQAEFEAWYDENIENLIAKEKYEEEEKYKDEEEEEDLNYSDISTVGSGRAPVWIRSLDLMNQRPIFGWGLENLLNEFYTQYNISEGRTHNLLLQLGACVGIPGVLIYFVAIIAIFLKSVYDVRLRRYSKRSLIIIAVVFVVLTIGLNVAICHITDKLLFNGIFTVILWAFLYMCIFFKNVRLRVKDWNYMEIIGATVFVSYMISDLFGNSAFYTSPYFMIFLGILVYEVLHKTPRFEEESAKEEIEDKK